MALGGVHAVGIQVNNVVEAIHRRGDKTVCHERIRRAQQHAAVSQPAAEENGHQHKNVLQPLLWSYQSQDVLHTLNSISCKVTFFYDNKPNIHTKNGISQPFVTSARVAGALLWQETRCESHRVVEQESKHQRHGYRDERR